MLKEKLEELLDYGVAFFLIMILLSTVCSCAAAVFYCFDMFPKFVDVVAYVNFITWIATLAFFFLTHILNNENDTWLLFLVPLFCVFLIFACAMPYPFLIGFFLSHSVVTVILALVAFLVAVGIIPVNFGH